MFQSFDKFSIPSENFGLVGWALLLCLILVQALLNFSYFWHWFLSAIQILGVLLGIFDQCCLSLLGVVFFSFSCCSHLLPTIPHYRVALPLLLFVSECSLVAFSWIPLLHTFIICVDCNGRWDIQ